MSALQREDARGIVLHGFAVRLDPAKGSPNPKEDVLREIYRVEDVHALQREDVRGIVLHGFVVRQGQAEEHPLEM